MTGVTALVRGTAYIMEASGYTYPAIDIGDILRDADILHISNEIPFAETCPKPFSNKANDTKLIFCSKPEYIQLLEAVGTDVVELTGDHFGDWGPEAMVSTLEMYEDRNWQYYGGGRRRTRLYRRHPAGCFQS
jgi:poly-gamma-glutamate synthesis protein (capsule biosynthesis protein)